MWDAVVGIVLVVTTHDDNSAANEDNTDPKGTIDSRAKSATAGDGRPRQ